MGVHETIVSTSNTINVIFIVIIWACFLISRRFGVLLLLHAVGSALISVNAGTFDVALRSQWKFGRRPVLVVPVILLAQLSSHIDWPLVLLFMRLSGDVGRI